MSARIVGAVLAGLLASYLWSRNLTRDAYPSQFRQSLDSARRPDRDFKDASRRVEIAPAEAPPVEKRSWTSRLVPEEWSDMADHLTDIVVPAWAAAVPGFVDKLQDELSGAPGSLAAEMWRDARDEAANPEIGWRASVRVSEELCDEERAFLKKRRPFTRLALARYLDINEADVHPDDVPTVAVCGSGGGLRAMVAGAASYRSAQRAGLFDCVTYTAGVSGSCWLQLLYFSSFGGQRFERVLTHLKHRLGVHIAFPPALLGLVTSAPTNKFLLSGAYEKWRGIADADFGVVDAYGIMLGARLLVPRGDLAVDSRDLKLTSQRRHVDRGAHPLPIYTAVRHEIPDVEQVDAKPGEDVRDTARREAWFQWFEFTPYEFSCEELGAGIPTWAVGREFDGGRDKRLDDGLAMPEVRTPLLLGVFGSAFCATLAHYYKEIRPVVQGLTGFGGMDGLISERNEDLAKVHPIAPAQFPNYVLGMADRLPATCPESVHKAHAIQLMDAGMSNNLPIYPLLRPGRDVDIIIAFDASADIERENWLRVADGYARQRGIKGWPIGTGWPDAVNDSGSSGEAAAETAKALDRADAASVDKQESKASSKDRQDRGGGQGRAGTEREVRQAADRGQDLAKPSDGTLGCCNVWVGSTRERSSTDEPPRSKLVEDGFELMEPDAGIAVVYFPFLANPAVKGVDPQASEYMSTWNFVYTPEQVDKVVELAAANFAAGEAKVKMCIRAVYERKRRKRLEREAHDRPWWELLSSPS